MPIKIPNRLPATTTLLEENIFVMTETRAITQDIRPLRVLMLNLMPQKIVTETQIARLIGNTPLQVELELVQALAAVQLLVQQPVPVLEQELAQLPVLPLEQAQ